MTDGRKEVDVLARTIWGEARGEGAQGMQAVANVIMNRVAKTGWWWGTTVEEVCKKPYQFSCWNANDPNSSKCMSIGTGDKIFQQCINIATLAVNGRLADITNGADHYHAASVHPIWADKYELVRRIGNHLFYKS